jgi:hypothetical protein
MRIPIRSRRRRRRLAAGGILLLVAGSVAGIVVIVGNTGKHFPEPVANEHADVYRAPPTHRLTAAEQKEVRRVAVVFIGSAVARRHLDDSYEIVGPEIREGLTRAEWHTGNIPVIPYQVESILHWTPEYSFQDDVAYEVVLAGKVRPKVKTFFIELKRFPRSGHPASWLVDSWTPSGISTDTPAAARRALAPPPKVEARLSAMWLLVPAGILGLLVAVPFVIVVRHWYAGRRARARFAPPA